MSRYQPYPSYKDSGVEWLGEVPEGWEIKPVKRVASCNDEVISESTPQDYGIEYVEISNVSSEKGIDETTSMLFSNAPSRARRRVKNGDVIVSTVRTYLRSIALVNNPPENMIVSTGFAVIRPRLIQANFLGYLFHAEFLVSEIIARSVGISYPAINASDLINLNLPFPSPTEQTAIANFLDRETAKIDTLIAKQERMIELLNEKRSAIISHAVTKGLDPNVKMKDSGVEWLGEVQEHWEVKKTKTFFKLITQPAPANNDYELLSIYTDIGVRPRKDLEAKGNKASTTDSYWMVDKGDLIVNKLLAWMGAIGYSAYDGVTSPAYDILRPSSEVNSMFYHYLFRTKIAQQEFKRWSRGIMEMRLRLYFDELGSLSMPVPPKKEQNQIIDYIQTAELKIDTLISKAQQTIELMKERRTALISAAVTGKIDVRGEVI